MLDLEILNALAKNLIRWAFALPFSGTAVMRTFRVLFSTPTISSRPALGIILTVRTTPSGVDFHILCRMRVVNVRSISWQN